MATKDLHAWSINLHDRNHMVITEASIYGSKKLGFYFKVPWYNNNNIIMVEVIPTETNYIDREQDHCRSPREMVEENVWQCLEKYRNSFMNCTLPWLSNNMPQGDPLCQHPEEYEQYLDLEAKLEPMFPSKIQSNAKCNPGCRRYGYGTTMYERGIGGINSTNMTICLYYNQFEFPVIDHVYAYDHLHLIADFGGYLGLLLGYSILGFYDTFSSILAKIRKILEKFSLVGKRTLQIFENT